MLTRPMSASWTRPTPAASSPAPPRQPLVPFEEDGDEASVSDDVDIEEDDEDDDEIDLDSYEAYLAEIQKKAAARPLSARALRPYPSESPAFYMVTTDNPVGPLGATSTPQPPPPNSNRPQRMPTRPASARSRLHSGDDAHQGASVSVPRAPLTARPTSASSSGQGRRKRQHPVTNDEPLSAHIRAAYSNVAPHARRGGRGGGGGAPLSSHTASSVVQRRLRVFQDADLQHEYHRLVDVVADLRTVVQHEQAQRTKAMARVRRLEEIVSLKDKKIDALLHGLGSSFGGDAVVASHQREMAQRERQHHALMQKLRQKLAQQTQLVASYEEATQALRTSVRSTRVLEMEHEIEQLQLEHGALHEALVAQSEELQFYSQQLAEAKAVDVHLRTQLARAHQELQRSDHERHKLEHETLLLRATVEQLEHKKRVHDHAVVGSPAGRSARTTPRKSPIMAKSPRVAASSSLLAEAMAEMRTLREGAENVAASPVRQRRPTPMPPRFSRPPSPLANDAECNEEGRVATQPTLQSTEEKDEGLETKTRGEGEGLGEKRVRWRGDEANGNDADSVPGEHVGEDDDDDERRRQDKNRGKGATETSPLSGGKRIERELEIETERSGTIERPEVPSEVVRRAGQPKEDKEGGEDQENREEDVDVGQNVVTKLSVPDTAAFHASAVHETAGSSPGSPSLSTRQDAAAMAAQAATPEKPNGGEENGAPSSRTGEGSYDSDFSDSESV